MRTITPKPFNVYKIEDLSGKALERACNEIRETNASEFWRDDICQDAKDKLEQMGFVDPQIYYDCSYSQGSGACFIARDMYKLNKFFAAIKKKFTKRQWKVLQKINKAGMDIKLTLHHHGHDHHEFSVTRSLDINDLGMERFVAGKNVVDYTSEIEDVINDWCVDFSRSIYKKLCETIEYFWNTQNCKKYAEENELEFTEDGSIFVE
jgi:hypothetical protein